MNEISLPQVIQRFIIASNNHHTEEMLACLSDKAVLVDHDREFKGIASIKEWSDGEFIGSRVNIEVIGIAFRGSENIVSTAINGDYPTPPYYFDFNFILKDDQITKLYISQS